jgi:hypothetical protein
MGAALERSGNLLLSIPGVSPKWLFKQTMKTVDESLDLTDAYIEGQPSIMALNRMASTAQAVPGGGVNDPMNQGARGADNTPQVGGPQGAQPAMTAPGDAKNQFASL